MFHGPWTILSCNLESENLAKQRFLYLGGKLGGVFVLSLKIDLFVGSTFVYTYGIFRRKGLFTETTWNAYSFQMIVLDVILYQSESSFLSTHFANAWYFLLGCSICLLSSWDHLLAFLHHWLNLIIKSLEVGIYFTWNRHCCRSIWGICIAF